MPRHTKDLKGMRFGMLSVLEYAGTKADSKGRTQSYWLCKCDCGNLKSVAARLLLNNSATSCGCRRKNGVKPIINMVGKKYSNLLVLEMIKTAPGKDTMCKCICDCGNEIIANSFDIRSGHTKSCGCLKHQPSKRIEDLSTSKFGLLKPLYMLDSKNKKTLWMCKCDCGNEVIAYASNLKNGHAKSCGCLKLKAKGMSNKRIYTIYKGMLRRCYNTNDRGYKNYGAKGVIICDQWLGEDGLYNFIEWALSNGYSDNLSIDRIDVNGNYEPSNCRWANDIIQANNKRTTTFLLYNGVKKPLTQWAKEFNISPRLLHQRKRLGWTDAQCIETKIGEKRV